MMMQGSSSYSHKQPPPTNCGVYLFSVRLYEEFGLTRYPEGGGSAQFPEGSSVATPKG